MTSPKGAGGSTVGYPSDSLASCYFMTRFRAAVICLEPENVRSGGGVVGNMQSSVFTLITL